MKNTGMSSGINFDTQLELQIIYSRYSLNRKKRVIYKVQWILFQYNVCYYLYPVQIRVKRGPPLITWLRWANLANRCTVGWWLALGTRSVVSLLVVHVYKATKCWRSGGWDRNKQVRPLSICGTIKIPPCLTRKVQLDLRIAAFRRHAMLPEILTSILCLLKSESLVISVWWCLFFFIA